MGLSSINCTQCGAGLPVLGGGRVLTQVCGYCGAVLDSQDNYKILTSIGKRNHPESPVQIGQTFKVEGVEFTVIGTLGMEEKHHGLTWTWVEHQVFSPTHGYAWLNWEDGHFTFSRKVRDFDMGFWLTSAAVEAAETPPWRVYRNENYKYYETSTAKIDFMEGEFNWVPQIGETVTTVSLLGPDAMLGLVAGTVEREVELTRLLPRDETARDLGIDPASLGPAGDSPLTPYRPIPEEGFLRRALMATALVAAVFYLVLSIMSGETLLTTDPVSVDSLPIRYQFDADSTAQLTELRFDTQFDNEWASFAAEITGPEGQPVVTGARTIQYYSGRDSEGSWSEGRRTGSFLFRVNEPGQHQITLARLDGTATTSTVSLTVTEGRAATFWMLIVGGLAVLGWAGLTARRAMHGKRRFAGTDWTED